MAFLHPAADRSDFVLSLDVSRVFLNGLSVLILLKKKQIEQADQPREKYLCAISAYSTVK
jgi:hypothetical protein